MNASPAKPDLTGLTGIARRLVANGTITTEEGHRAMQEGGKARQPLHKWMLENKAAPSQDITTALAMEFGLPVLDLACFDVSQAPVNMVKEEWLQKHGVLPLAVRNQRVFVAISDPTDTRAIDEFKFQVKMPVDQVMADPDQIRQALDLALSSTAALDMGDEADGLENITTSAEEELEAANATGSDATADDTPIVKFINKSLIDAIARGASDIHFEPYETELRVRLRVDGVLKQVSKVPIKHAARMTARLKVMASLDIAERRLPQDGRIKLNISKTKQMDFRVSTCPTLFGEKVVLRILDANAAKLGIDKLGYDEDQKELYMSALSKPYGMILVTGPTGSGKTVSLYTGLNILNTDEVNISTAEDPVEIRVHGINQVQVNPKKGMTFAAALRSFLRQDPDVIMVGEIRDIETAEIAVKAAQTGHMVLSTLHTNDAPQTIARLSNMGIPSYNIVASVMLVIAQRLARRLCPACRRPHNLPPNAMLEAGFTQADIDAGLVIYEAVGCNECNEGYKGRVGVYQVMPMLDSIARVILDGGDAMKISEAAAAAGVRDLRQSALIKVRAGMTSLTEADRVTLV